MEISFGVAIVVRVHVWEQGSARSLRHKPTAVDCCSWEVSGSQNLLLFFVSPSPTLQLQMRHSLLNTVLES